MMVTYQCRSLRPWMSSLVMGSITEWNGKLLGMLHSHSIQSKLLKTIISQMTPEQRLELVKWVKTESKCCNQNGFIRMLLALYSKYFQTSSQKAISHYISGKVEKQEFDRWCNPSKMPTIKEIISISSLPICNCNTRARPFSVSDQLKWSFILLAATDIFTRKVNTTAKPLINNIINYFHFFSEILQYLINIRIISHRTDINRKFLLFLLSGSSW